MNDEANTNVAGASRGPLSAPDLITLNDEIAAMARAGLPLDQGLRALAREMRSGRLQRVTAAVAADLEAGRTLPEALDAQAGRVPPFYGALVSAGVRSGRLDSVLATLTIYARSIADLRATVIGAVFYPVVVLIVACALFGFIASFLLPQFDHLFRGFGINLPPVTRAALAIGRHPIEVFVVGPGSLVMLIILTRLALTGGFGQYTRTRLLYSVPLVGTLIRSSRMAAFVDLLAILVEHELPLPAAFRLAGEAASDPIMAMASGQIESDLSGGMPLAESLRNRRAVPGLMAWMMLVGERRGRLAESLRQAAEVYRRQAEMRALLLRSVLPPVLLLGISAVVVGFFIAALFMPLIKLITELSG